MLSCVWSTHEERRKKEGEKVGKIKAGKMPLLKHKTNEMKEIESFER